MARSGPPLVLLPGLSAEPGVSESDPSFGPIVGPLAPVHRVFLVGRRPGLQRGTTMAGLAAEHAAALRDAFDAPVDVLGISTGGSIAQQLAADHPGVVGRLVLVSTACRLGPAGRELQRRVAARIRAGPHRQATKRFGRVEAVRDASFSARPGRVTAFLGPNGAGKSTTLRSLLGLIRPTSGRATFAGRRYDELDDPSRRVGAVLEDASFHPGRTGRNHLRVLATTAGLPPARVGEVLALVELEGGADRRVEGYSMGMRQRWRSPPRCSATPTCSCSTSPRTASTPRASAGCGRSCARTPTAGAPCSSRATSSPRSSRSPTTSSSSPGGPCGRTDRSRACSDRATAPPRSSAARTPPGSPSSPGARGSPRSPRAATRSWCTAPTRRRWAAWPPARASSSKSSPTARARSRTRFWRWSGRTGDEPAPRRRAAQAADDPAFVALTIAAAALALLITGLSAGLSDVKTEHDVRSFVIADTAQLFILVLGIVGMVGEWRHRTITGTVLAAPHRVRLVLAKVAAYAVAGVVLSLVVNALSMALGTVILSARDLPTLDAAGLADLLWRNLVLAALHGALGVGIGGLLRNQAAALVLVLVVSFAVEPVLVNLAPEVGRFGPLTAAPTAFLGTEETLGDDVQLLAPAVGLLVMAGWTAALAAATAATLERRDLT